MVLDSNILIYAAEPNDFRCSHFVDREDAAIASVTRIEVLGFPGYNSLTEDRQARLREILATVFEIQLDESIIEHAIQLRRQKRMRLADAVIAATALANNMELVTRNIADFKHIAGLCVIDPFRELD